MEIFDHIEFCRQGCGIRCHCCCAMVNELGASCNLPDQSVESTGK